MALTKPQQRYKAKVRDKNLMRNYLDMTSEVRTFKDMPSALVKENRKRVGKLLGRPHPKTGCRVHNNSPQSQNGFGHGLVTITMLRDGKKVTKKLPIQHAVYLLHKNGGEMPILAEGEEVYQNCDNPYCGEREHIKTTKDPSQIVKGIRKNLEPKHKPKPEIEKVAADEADSGKSKRREAVGKDDGFKEQDNLGTADPDSQAPDAPPETHSSKKSTPKPKHTSDESLGKEVLPGDKEHEPKDGHLSTDNDGKPEDSKPAEADDGNNTINDGLFGPLPPKYRKALYGKSPKRKPK